MKKIGYLFISIISFIGISNVNADTNLNMSRIYDIYPFYDDFTKDNSSVIDDLISYYNDNWSNDYSYYIIFGNNLTTGQTKSNYIYLAPTNSSDIYGYYDNNSHSYIYFNNTQSVSFAYSYNISTNSYEIISNLDTYTWNLLYFSNTTLYFKSSDNNRHATSITIPSYSNNDLDVSYPQYNISDGDEVPTYMSLANPLFSYTEVNLNDYEYIILSLKNYNVSEDFISKMYQKGQVCSTTLYDYGLEEKKNYISGYETQACSTYYDELTTIRSNIKVEDANHHSVYYLSAYDNTKENTIYIDSNIYDITYITSENADNPTIVVNGSTYSTLPYSSLSDSAILTYENGYSDTWTCAKYDSDCIFKSTGLSIDEIFSHPIQSLKTVWGAIASMLALISTFIALLPPTMQGFLYMSFALAIILGIIKILL